MLKRLAVIVPMLFLSIATYMFNLFLFFSWNNSLAYVSLLCASINGGYIWFWVYQLIKELE